jgi:signal transduction histidine kinase
VSSKSVGQILICDDNEQNRYIVSKYLMEAGFSVWEAATGQGAIDLVSRLPDIVILDVQLPDMSGYEVCKWIKANPVTSSIPVMHVSATFVRGADRVEGLDSGADAYLTSPVEPPELIATIKALLRARRAEEEYRRANEQLLDAAQRKDQFLAMLGHELRNPLGPIRNAVHVIKKSEKTNSTVLRASEMIERQVTHLARLVDDLLDVSRLSSGKILLRRRKMDVVRTVRLAIEDQRHAFSANDLSLEEALPAEPIWIDADPDRVAQVMGNLLNNALKFTDSGGSVKVTLTVDSGDMVRITVKDTGIGMSSEMLSRLFEPFAQAESTLDRSRGGLGLGLALVKGVADLHGGSVQATSEGAGKGTEVSVLLPAEKNQKTPEVINEGTGYSSGSKKILVIEDNLDAAESINMLLTLEGFSVRVAHDGAAGIAEAVNFHPDVILCDIGLPGAMDGYGVAASVRKSPELASIAMIALTGYGQESDLLRAKHAGFDYHVVKPVDPNELAKLLSAIPENKSTATK